MLTIHTAPLLRLDAAGGEVIEDGAVVVADGWIEAVGPLARLTGRYPRARVRDWPGTLGPALVHDGPLPPAPSPRERVYAVLRQGATAVAAEHVADPALRAAAHRSGLVVRATPLPLTLRPSARADLAVFDADGECVATVLAGRVLHRRR